MLFINRGDIYFKEVIIGETSETETDREREVPICEQQYGFMPGKSTTDAMFALRMLMERYRSLGGTWSMGYKIWTRWS